VIILGQLCKNGKRGRKVSSDSGKPAISYEIEALLGALNNDLRDADIYSRQYRSTGSVRAAEIESQLDPHLGAENRFAKRISEAMAKSNWHVDDGPVS
jgi:hypothetical protein